MPVDGEFPKALLLVKFAPSTSTHYMGSKLNIFVIPRGLHTLMTGSLVYDSGIPQFLLLIISCRLLNSSSFIYS